MRHLCSCAACVGGREFEVSSVEPVVADGGAYSSPNVRFISRTSSEIMLAAGWCLKKWMHTCRVCEQKLHGMEDIGWWCRSRG